MDTFSKIEKYLYQGSIYAALFGVPLLATKFSDLYVSDGAGNLVKHGFIIAAIIVGYIISFVVISSLESSITKIRKLLGMKTLVEIEDQIQDEELDKEEKKEERDQRYYNNLNSSEQNYVNWQILRFQRDQIKKIKSDIDFLRFAVIAFIVYEIVSKYSI